MNIGIEIRVIKPQAVVDRALSAGWGPDPGTRLLSNWTAIFQLYWFTSVCMRRHDPRGTGVIGGNICNVSTRVDLGR